MRRFSILDKLILASIALSLVTILVVASYSFFNAKKAILERTFNQLTSVRVVKKNLVEKFFSNCITEIKLAKSSSDIIDILHQINKLEKTSEHKIIEDNLINYNKTFINEVSKNYYTKISIIGNNNYVFNIKNSTPEITTNTDHDLFNQVLNSNDTCIIKDLTKHTENSSPIITIISKVLGVNNEPDGIIIFELSLDPINLIMLEKSSVNGLGNSGETYLVGHDYLMRSTSRFQENSVLQTTVKTVAVDSAFKDKAGTEVIKDYRNISVLSSYSKINIPNLNWVILTEIDYREATIPIYKIRNEIIFISIFIFVFILIVVFILSKRITSPVIKLNRAAHEIGSGNLDVEVEYDSNDEIGELTISFNKMIKQLKKQQEELEEERAKRLSSIIDGQETERQRLSRELHDSLGQLLIGLKLKYESCINQSNIDNPTNVRFNELALLFDKTIEETRRISNNLMPAALSQFGLTTAIRNLCNEINDTSNIKIEYDFQGSSSNFDLKIKTYIYRVIQEALTNIIKHADAKNVKINLNSTEDKIRILIEDDGKGFDISTKIQNTNGLNNMKDRISLLSGIIIIKSEFSKGTKINIEVPIKAGKNE